MEELCYWMWLNMVPGIGGRRFRILLERFGSPRRVWGAGEAELMGVPGIGRDLAQAIVLSRPTAEPEAELTLVRRAGVQVLTIADPTYPRILSQIYDPPAVLYVWGNLLPADDLAVAVVGSRRTTAYGRGMAGRIAADLVAAGVTVVSGLARGIDAAAHRGALAGGGRTIAVLGSGLECIYPPEHAGLADQISKQGAVISEFPMLAEPVPGNFPARNRVISGLARGTLVVEAGERSGALITADLALEQGREVFALPGNVTSPGSRGPHRLIVQGARLIEGAADILDELGMTAMRQTACTGPAASAEGLASLAPDERTVLVTLDLCTELVLAATGGTGVTCDELVAASGLGAARTLAALSLLEIRGHVERLPGGRYIRRPGTESAE